MRRYRSRFHVDARARCAPPTTWSRRATDRGRALSPLDRSRSRSAAAGRASAATVSTATRSSCTASSAARTAADLELELARRRRPSPLPAGRHRRARAHARFTATRAAGRRAEDGREDAWELVDRAAAAPARSRREASAVVASAGGRGARARALARRHASLSVRPASATVEQARWTEDGTLELAGEIRAPGDGRRARPRRALDPAQPRVPDARGRGARALQRPARRPRAWRRWTASCRSSTTPGSCACGVPATPASTRRDGGRGAARASSRWSPWSTTSRSGSGMDADGAVILAVRIDLDSDERGRYRQRRLRATVYQPGRSEPLRDTVVYTSFRGRQYSDNPRAIHEELVRRDAPLEHLWVVGDERLPGPADGDGRARRQPRALRRARARALRRRQRPLPGLVRAAARPAVPADAGTARRSSGSASTSPSRAGRARRFERHWQRHQINWQYVLSPNRFSTPILRRRLRDQAARCSRPATRATTCSRAPTATCAARAIRGAAGRAGGRARRALRPDLPRPRPRPPRPLPARAGARRRAACAHAARARHGGPVPQAPLHRRPRAGDRGRLRARRLDLSRRRPSCCSPPTCSSPTTPR